MNPSKPKVVVIATGGTIAGLQPDDGKTDYEAGKVEVNDLIAAVPEAGKLATLSGVQLVSIGSQDMTADVWLRLAREIETQLDRDDVAGVVVTHGTDTMEETAYFLNLIVESRKPVVLTGAMRPATSLSADGPLNLFNSVAVAASESAVDHGVLVVANDFIHGAREVIKTNTLTVQAFESSDLGLLGAMHYGELRMFRKPHRLHTADSVFAIRDIDSLPKVLVVYAHSNMDGEMVRCAVEHGARGIVLAGVGNGNASQKALDALSEAVSQGVVVVRSTRSNDGAVLRNHEINDDELKFVVSDQLNPAKARVLLQLALTQTNDVQRIQEFFLAY
ncbi:MAG: type II asparaginase [Planctomycetota bacterium]